MGLLPPANLYYALSWTYMHRNGSYLLSHKIVIPSTQTSLTSLFGMGRGVLLVVLTTTLFYISFFFVYITHIFKRVFRYLFQKSFEFSSPPYFLVVPLYASP